MVFFGLNQFSVKFENICTLIFCYKIVFQDLKELVWGKLSLIDFLLFFVNLTCKHPLFDEYHAQFL